MNTSTIIVFLFSAILMFNSLSAKEINHSVFNWDDLGRSERDSLLIPVEYIYRSDCKRQSEAVLG